MTSFADRLTEATRSCATPLCVGLDPFSSQIPKLFQQDDELKGLEAFFSEVIDRVAGKVPSIKPQLGLFEPWGGSGVALVGHLTAYAKSKNLLVILDAKRGDIGSTADGYAEAYLGKNPTIPADCLTINPYLGLDSLRPFASRAKDYAKGIAVLVRTSNPGAEDFQSLDCEGAPLWVRVAEKLSSLEFELIGGQTYSSLMVVCGATWPEEAKRLRTILSKSLFLIPGYGAQGGAAIDALAGLIAGPAGPEGGVVSSSRGILYPKACSDAPSLSNWRLAFSANLDAAIRELRVASETVVEVK